MYGEQRRAQGAGEGLPTRRRKHSQLPLALFSLSTPRIHTCQSPASLGSIQVTWHRVSVTPLGRWVADSEGPPLCPVRRLEALCRGPGHVLMSHKTHKRRACGPPAGVVACKAITSFFLLGDVSVTQARVRLNSVDNAAGSLARCFAAVAILAQPWVSHAGTGASVQRGPAVGANGQAACTVGTRPAALCSSAV